MLDPKYASKSLANLKKKMYLRFKTFLQLYIWYFPDNPQVGKNNIVS